MNSLQIIIRKVERQSTREFILDLAKAQLFSPTMIDDDKKFYKAIVLGFLETASFYNG
jgi:hypothetical protein